MGETTTLARLAPGSRAVVREVNGGEFLRKKLLAVGILPESGIKKISSAPSGASVVETAGCRFALGRRISENVVVETRPCRVLLAGNPNVGKSAVFSRLTGTRAESSNYPGTTVEVLRGKARLAGVDCEIVDVPGAYSLSPSSKAEEAAGRILGEEKDCAIVYVADAANLERSLFFALEVISLGRPAVVLLNKWDLARSRGVLVDEKALAAELGIACVPFVAATGEGIKDFEAALSAAFSGGSGKPVSVPSDDGEKWKLIGAIIKKSQRVVHRHPTLAEKIAEMTSGPVSGPVLAVLFSLASFYAVRGLAEGLISKLLEPVFSLGYMPLLRAVSPEGWHWRIFFGGAGGPLDSFGLLTTGVYIAFVLVLPYVLAFYAILGIWEDTGYLPRLAVLVDGGLHKLGLHGYAAVPVMLGLGCKVPAIMATRILETRRERIIALSLALAVAPCIPQSAMIMAVVGRWGLRYALAVFGALFVSGIFAAAFLNKIMKGQAPELFVEIPAWQWPRLNSWAAKLWLRVKNYAADAAPMIMLAAFALAILDNTGAARFIAGALGKPVSALLGLPADTAALIALGFFRKDIIIALLPPFSLSPGQLVVAGFFLALYFPCLASFSVLVREMGLKDAFRVIAVNLALALCAGAALNLLRHVF